MKAGERSVRYAAAGLLTMLPGAAAHADEPLFGYVNTTDLLPQGKLQIEQWATLRQAAGRYEYRAWEGRSEIEYGLASNLQLTGYVNYSRVDAKLGAVAAGAFPAKVARSRVDGVTGEAIVRVASPYLAPVGVALLADVTVGRDRPAFGFKAIVQKNLSDDTVVLAANLRLDLAADRGPRIEGDLGASYRFMPNWSAGFELRSRRRYAQGDLQDAALLLGPGLHYGAQRWFFTLSALRRVHDRHRATPADPADRLGFLAERARWDGIRLRIGRTF